MMAQFRRGEFHEYRATNKIHLGKHQVDIEAEDIIEYDGVTLKMGPDEYNTTLLRKAIAKGWLVPSADTTSRYIPQPSGVTVGPAETGNPMDYKNKRRLADNSRQMGIDSMSNEGTVVSGRGFTNFNDPNNKNRREGVVGAGRRMDVEVLDQEHVVVSSVSKLPSRGESTLVENSAIADRQIKKTLGTPRTGHRQNMRPVSSGTPQPDIDTSNLSEDESAMLAILMKKMGKTAAPQPVARQTGEVGTAREDDYIPPDDAPWIKTEDEQAQAKADADAARAERLGSMGVDPGDPDSIKNAKPPLASTAKAEVGADGTLVLDDLDDLGEEPEAEMDMEELLAGTAPPDSEEIEKRIRQEKLSMIQTMMPGFTWDFDLQWRKRVKIAVTEHYGKPTLQAIKQIETAAVVKYIEEYEAKRAEQEG